MILLRLCGHSEDTDSIRYRRNPLRCFYCAYLLKHPRLPVADTPRGIANGVKSRKYWADVRSGARTRIVR